MHKPDHDHVLAVGAAPANALELATALDSVPVLIWVSGPDKAGTYFNQTWLEFTGKTLKEELGDGWLSNIHPEDMPALEACASAFLHQKPFQTEFRLRRWDGAWRWMLDTGIPRFTPTGRFAGYIGCCTDITDRKLAEEQREVLIRELDHRVKNTLATVQALANATLPGSPAAQSYFGRLKALAQAHRLLAETSWDGGCLETIVTTVLAPYSERAHIHGGGVRLAPRAAQTVCMAVHELTTNAVKYGALSAPEGRIAVSWSIFGGCSDGVLSMSWHEFGGPTANGPIQKGFGCKLIEQAVPYELDGRTELRFSPDGLSCMIEMPCAGNVRRVRPEGPELAGAGCQ